MELKMYLGMIYKKLWLIVVFVLLASILAGVKSYYLTTPLYQANAKLIVNQSSGSGVTDSVNVGTLQTNIILINSYKEIIKSSAILNKVMEKYPDLRVSPGKITVASANNSQIMSLLYTDTSYLSAARSINAIANVFKQEIPSIMKIDNVTILSEAIEKGSPSPFNLNPLMNFAVFIAIALMLAIGIIFLMDYLDNTYKTEAELEQDLGLPTLALVTNIKKADLNPRRQPPASKKQKVGEGAYAPLNQ